MAKLDKDGWDGPFLIVADLDSGPQVIDEAETEAEAEEYASEYRTSYGVGTDIEVVKNG